MAKQRSAGVLNALVGKKVLFQGRFAYGVQERLTAMAAAQQGTIVTDLDASVDYLVLADLTGGKTVQKKALSLNAKGASVQVIDTDAFAQLTQPTLEQIKGLIRGGKANAELLAKALGGDYPVFARTSMTQTGAIIAQKFEGLDLSGFELVRFPFERCSFRGTTLQGTRFGSAVNCDFGNCAGESASFWNAGFSLFVGARLKGAHFEGSIEAADFSASVMEGAVFSEMDWTFGGSQQQQPHSNCRFAGGIFQSARFEGLSLKAPDFDNADLTSAIFADCQIDAGCFRRANLQGATLVGCKFPGANLAGANLRAANLADADLTNACLDGADLAGCNLRGAMLTGVDLSKTRNYDPNAVPAGAVGPVLTELDSLGQAARRIQISFHVRTGKDDDGEEVSVDTSGLRYGWGMRLPRNVTGGYRRNTSIKTISAAMMQIAKLLGQRQVRYETVEVSSTKSPKGGKELRDLALRGIAEAFAQPLPAEEELAAAAKAYREQARQKNSAERREREKERKEEEKRQEAAKKQISKKVAKQVGKVTDIASFLKALEVRIESPKIKKATQMLKAERFKLFNDVTDEHMSGVVKSQTDPDLVYACRIDHDGHYACCTQNLNICGGLRGSICKHLLVLIVGLVKAGELDPSTIDEWIAKTHLNKAELDKEKMGEIFLKYKGAEAGEVDWRPTETVPEDYYAL